MSDEEVKEALRRGMKKSAQGGLDLGDILAPTIMGGLGALGGYHAAKRFAPAGQSWLDAVLQGGGASAGFIAGEQMSNNGQQNDIPDFLQRSGTGSGFRIDELPPEARQALKEVGRDPNNFRAGAYVSDELTQEIQRVMDRGA